MGARTALKRLIAEKVPKEKRPQHFHWNWARKALRLSLLAYRGFGIECDGQWQGLMLTLTEGHAARLSPDTGKPLVYIDFIEAAPWNVVPLSKSVRYRGIGVQLFQAAVRQSVDEGFHGRVGLHALRDAEEFYQKRGMVSLGADATYQNLHYFELSVASAQTFLARR